MQGPAQDGRHFAFAAAATVAREFLDDDEIRVWIPGDGHLILRNLVLRPTTGGGNLFVNGGVTTLNNNNLDGWQSRGTHWGGYHDAEGVHLVAGHARHRCLSVAAHRHRPDERCKPAHLPHV